MLRYLLTFAFLSSLSYAICQDFTIRGKVTDSSNKPLEGVSLRIEALELSTLTNNLGEYSFSIHRKIAKSPLIVVATCVGKKALYKSCVPDSVSKRMDFVLEDMSLALDEINVQATTGSLSNSSLVFDREMIERYPALSLNDLLNQLPNRKNSAPSVQELQNLTLRGAFSKTTGRARDVDELNNTFGVSIIIDDIALSNNGNMQGRNPGITGMANATNAIKPSDYGLTGRPETSDSYSGENVFGGIDLRQIPVENIEKVEVISGVAPARYGDLSNGAVIIERQAGVTPTFFRVQVRSNATSYGVSKGFNLGERLGAVNLNVGYVSSYADNRDKLKQYDRINGTLIWTNYLDRDKRIKQTFSTSYSKVIDRVNRDPDDPLSAAISFGGWNLSVSNRFSYQVNKAFIKNINFNAGFSTNKQKTYREYYYNGAVVLYTDSLQTGIVEGQYAPGQYTAVDHVDNKPLNMNGRVEANGLLTTGPLLHRLNFGLNYSLDMNRGKGRIADPSIPKKDLAGTRSDRYYDYSRSHPLHNIGLYIEDVVRKRVMDRDLSIRAGLRWDVMNGHSSLSPRTNITYALSEALQLGLAYGISVKSPGLAQLYPGPTFDEIILLNAFNGKVEESISLIYLRRYEKDNSSLKSSFGQTFESSLFWKGNGHNLRANLFYKINDRLVNTVEDITVLELPEFKATPVSGQKPIVEEVGKNKYLVSNLYFSNPNLSRNSGLELMYSTPRIDPIMTRISGTVGLTLSDFRSKSLQKMSLNSNTTDMDDIILGYFPARSSKSYLSRGQIRSSTHFPALRLVIELSADCELLNYSKLHYRDFYPVAYYTADYTYHQIEKFDPDNANHQKLYMKRKEEAKRANSDNFIYWNFNLNMAKEIGKNLYLSFNVYNFLDYQPRFYKESWTSVKAPNSSVNYGAQLTYKF